MGTPSVPSHSVGFITWATPGLAAFTFGMCLGRWLPALPWTPQRVWGKTSPGEPF